MKSFKTLQNDFIENRWRISVGLIALLIVDVLQLFIPRVVKYAIDDLTLGTASHSRLLVYGV
jgi:ATP-binding cassette subfamily B multidrug efflux pump